MKICTKCGLSEPQVTFEVQRRQCVECVQAYNKAYYAKNAQKFKEYRETNRGHYRKLNVEILRRKRLERYAEYERIKSVPCTDCGEPFPSYVMDFDHRDPLTKLGNVSTMVKKSIPWETVLKEIEKCDVVCANCHRVRTHERAHPNACKKVEMSPERMRWERRQEGAVQTTFQSPKKLLTPKRRPWHDHVGKMTDLEVSKLTGISRSSVSMYRKKVGLPTFREIKAVAA